MAIQSRPLTYEDLRRLRETRHERLELIEGELFVTPSPTPFHQRVSKRLNRILLQVVDDAGIGEFHYAPLDVKLADGSIVQPDLFVVFRERFEILVSSPIEGVPDFVIEIVSPSTGDYDQVTKRDLYARHGVPEYWLVDPDARTVTIFTNPREGRYRTRHVAHDVARAATIHGLSIVLEELFSPFPGA